MASKRKRKYTKSAETKPKSLRPRAKRAKAAKAKNKGPKLTSRESLALETLQNVERKGLAEGHRDEPWMQTVASTIATLKRL